MKALELMVSGKNIFHVFPYISLCKTFDPWGRQFLPQGHNLNSGGPLGDATYQILSFYLGLVVSDKNIFKFSSQKTIFSMCDLDMQWLIKF